MISAECCVSKDESDKYIPFTFEDWLLNKKLQMLWVSCYYMGNYANISEET